MKKLLSILSAMALLFINTSCDRDDTDSVSIVRNYPVITLNGTQGMSILLGETYTEPGAVATLNGATIPMTTSGTVDNTQVGLNFITYSSKNPEGDSVSARRVVAVIPPSAVGLPNISGKYKRSGFNAFPEVTKMAEGLYRTSNLGGVDPSTSSAVYPAYFILTGPTTILAPEQEVPGVGKFDFTNESITINGPNVSFTWTVINSGFGTAPRTFVKQQE